MDSNCPLKLKLCTLLVLPCDPTKGHCQNRLKLSLLKLKLCTLLVLPCDPTKGHYQTRFKLDSFVAQVVQPFSATL